MKRELTKCAEKWIITVALWLPLVCRADQFVEISTKIEDLQWDYWFLCDHNGKYPGEAGTPTIFREPQTRRCVVGEKVWMIEGNYSDSKVTHWFTGTNVIEHTVLSNGGRSYTRIYDSADGNPGRPVRVADLLFSDFAGKVSWLAFCSGPALRQEGRRIYPPSPFWKEYVHADSWSEAAEFFKDDLGLPKKIDLLLTNNQSIFQYQVRQSTNVLGWNFPLEFYGVHYLPAGTNTWKLHMTSRGRVTSIHPGQCPEIPADVMKADSMR